MNPLRSLLDGWREFWGLSWWAKGPILGVLALLLVVIISIAVASGGGGDEDTGAVSEEPTATATVEAEPTEEATEAAEPTPTSPPEEADTDDLDAGLAYIVELGTLVADMSLVLNNLVDLSTEAGADPTVLLDEGWFRDLAREQDRLNAAESTFLALQPPPQYAETHRLMTQALNEMDIALGLFEAGGRDLDPTKLIEAADHLRESTQFIEQATATLPQVP